MTLNFCVSSRCPLADRCGPQGHAAFTVFGGHATRVSLVPPRAKSAVDPIPADEAATIGAAVQRLGLRSVALLVPERDDLADGGAGSLIALVRALRAATPSLAIEIHAGDFGGQKRVLREVFRLRPALFQHALWSTPKLYPKLSPGSDYVRSLETLRLAREEFEGVRLRSTIALGLGESRDELVASLADLKSVGVEEAILAWAEPAQRKNPIAPEALAKVVQVGERLKFPRLEVLDVPRTCAAPPLAAGAEPQRSPRSLSKKPAKKTDARP